MSKAVRRIIALANSLAAWGLALLRCHDRSPRHRP